MNALNLLRETGFSALSYQFACYIDRQQTQPDPVITLTAGLLSETVSDGHVCLNIQQYLAPEPAIQAALPSATQWQEKLENSDMVGGPGAFKPLILTPDGLLYLYRYWQAEQQVASAIRQRLSQTDLLPDAAKLQSFMAAWQNNLPDTDWQKVAVLSTIYQQLTVISGGPGTGKTTVILKILQCFHLLDSPMRVALAAPTGKAAARLQQVINQQTNEQYTAQTLHRLLGISARFDQGRYSADRPLPVDVLIVDEASMIDINLMAITLQALPLHARLVLVGDSDQLASVESGAVLANLCAQKPSFSKAFSDWVKQSSNIDLPVSTQKTPMQDSLITLQHSYRFAAGGQIGLLARTVNQGDTGQLSALLNMHEATQLFTPALQQLQTQMMSGYRNFIDAIEQHQAPENCLRAFEQFRVLCAVKQGSYSVAGVNGLMGRLLNQRGWQTRQDFYAGRPVLITGNHYRLNLFNGDIGLVLPNSQGELQACFYFSEVCRWVPLSRLPRHETAFAMTVHKSQGSEFDQIMLLLPDDDSPLLSRELIYTALTRARKAVSILANTQILNGAVQRRHQRETGLSQLLAVDDS